MPVWPSDGVDSGETVTFYEQNTFRVISLLLFHRFRFPFVALEFTQNLKNVKIFACTGADNNGVSYRPFRGNPPTPMLR